MERDKIKSFTDLKAWEEGHKLVLTIYEITKTFPREELFALTSQIRRASISITSNIAEGFSRNSSKEKLHFYHMALGSLTEVQNQLLVARDVGYISGEIFKQASERTIVASKLIHGLMKTVSSRIENI